MKGLQKQCVHERHFMRKKILSFPNPTDAFEGANVMLPDIRAAPGSANRIISLLYKTGSSSFWVDDMVIPSRVLNDCKTQCVCLCLNWAQDPI